MTLVRELGMNLQLDIFYMLSEPVGYDANSHWLGAEASGILFLNWHLCFCQAIARVWREGQLKPVIIYRFFSTGRFEDHSFISYKSTTPLQLELFVVLITYFEYAICI